MGGKVNYYANGFAVFRAGCGKILCSCGSDKVPREHYFGFHTGSYLVMNTERMYLKQNSKTLILTCVKKTWIITEYKYKRLTFL